MGSCFLLEASENWGLGVPCPYLDLVATKDIATAGVMSGGLISRCFLLSEPRHSWGQGIKGVPSFLAGDRKGQRNDLGRGGVGR